MGQVTIYLEDEIEQLMRTAAKSMHMSQSKWIARLIKENVSNEWPRAVCELAGAWPDMPTAEEIRKSIGPDAHREEL